MLISCFFFDLCQNKFASLINDERRRAGCFFNLHGLISLGQPLIFTDTKDKQQMANGGEQK
jgi:hypothetical protein